jgi:hypothetical protein
MLHDDVDRLDERRPRQLSQLVELVVGVRAFREHGEQQALLRLGRGG